MIIKLFNKKGDLQSSHSFKQNEVILGRNPKVQNSVLIDSQSVSRSHLKLTLKNNKIKIQDLNSSNGTFINGEQISKNQKITLKQKDQITIGQFQGYVTVLQRQNQKKKNDSSSQSQSEQEQRQRSRQKKNNKKGTQIHIAESTLKMLRSMTADKKSKAQKIKFLKLMGYSQAQQSWDEIEQMIKSKKSYFLSNANKKASQELEKQFSQGRFAHQKRGLGR